MIASKGINIKHASNAKALEHEVSRVSGLPNSISASCNNPGFGSLHALQMHVNGVLDNHVSSHCAMATSRFKEAFSLFVDNTDSINSPYRVMREGAQIFRMADDAIRICNKANDYAALHRAGINNECAAKLGKLMEAINGDAHSKILDGTHESLLLVDGPFGDVFYECRPS